MAQLQTTTQITFFKVLLPIFFVACGLRIKVLCIYVIQNIPEIWVRNLENTIFLMFIHIS